MAVIIGNICDLYSYALHIVVSSNLQVKRFGKPTWRKLVEAVEDKVGGNNPALAQRIAGEHLGAYGNRIYSSLLTIRSSVIYCSFH